MNIEKKIVSYLSAYGNTRESDLIGYGVQDFHRSPVKMKKIVDRMVIKGKIYRIVHNKLKPPEVYVTLEELLYPEIMRDLLAAQVSESTVEDPQSILKEAAAIAEQRKKDELQGSKNS
jgi:hypothetical protein